MSQTTCPDRPAAYAAAVEARFSTRARHSTRSLALDAAFSTGDSPAYGL